MASERNTTTINVTMYEGDEELFSLTREEKNNKGHDVVSLVADGMGINHSGAVEMVNQALDEIILKISLAIGIQKMQNTLTSMVKREKDES